jgi:hypothetical protein
MVHQPLVGSVVGLLQVQGEGVVEAGLLVLPDLKRQLGGLPGPNGDARQDFGLQDITGIELLGLLKPDNPGPQVVELAPGPLQHGHGQSAGQPVGALCFLFDNRGFLDAFKRRPAKFQGHPQFMGYALHPCGQVLRQQACSVVSPLPGP